MHLAEATKLVCVSLAAPNSRTSPENMFEGGKKEADILDIQDIQGVNKQVCVAIKFRFLADTPAVSQV